MSLLNSAPTLTPIYEHMPVRMEGDGPFYDASACMRIDYGLDVGPSARTTDEPFVLLVESGALVFSLESTAEGTSVWYSNPDSSVTKLSPGESIELTVGMALSATGKVQGLFSLPDNASEGSVLHGTNYYRYSLDGSIVGCKGACW